MNNSCLVVPGCWSSTTRKDAGCADADESLDGCCTLAITVAGCVVATQRLHNWYRDWLSIQYGDYVFMSCCGLCCFWKLKCRDLLSCCDLSLAFFSLVLYPEVQKVSLLQVFNLRVEIIAEQLSWTLRQKIRNHRLHLLELI